MSGTKNNDKANTDNRSRQLNPQDDAYWRSRGEPGRPASDDETPPPAPGGGGKKPG